MLNKNKDAEGPSLSFWCDYIRSSDCLAFLITQVWRFRDAAATFKGMESPQAQNAFQMRIDHVKPVTQPEIE